MKSFLPLKRLVPILLTTTLAACNGEPRDTAEPVATLRAPITASTWTALKNAPPGFLDNCVLLTDGTAMCHEYNTNRWHGLRPDALGSYANGTWDSPPIANMPNGSDPNLGCTSCTYAPLYFSSAVLPDGRVVVIGGEYVSLIPVWTNMGFIYNPATNTWSSQLNEAFGSGSVGDAMGAVLANGTYALSNIGNTNLELLNPTTLTFTAQNPTGKLDVNDEEGWNLLYDGSLLAVDSRIASSFERYNATTNTWGNSGSTGVNLADTGAGTGNSEEVGPGVLRPDGKLVYFSGNSTGQSALYDTATNTWSHTSSMDFPLVPGQTYHFAQADGPASLLPNGNVLAMASPVIVGSPFNSPSHFYELGLSDNTVHAVTDSPSAASFAAYQGRMLLLPTGEVLLTAYNQGSVQDVMLYSNGGAPLDAWRPSIAVCPTTIAAGNTYSISGTLFNGFSQGASYGDDAQSYSNYPLVRITNNATGHVFYARTHDHSSMGVEAVGSTTSVTTTFDVPAGLESGASTLVVVANGIASQPCAINNSGGNNPPVALCKAVTVTANSMCKGAASIDNGSFDPDGDPFTCVQAPPSPYGRGATNVTLTCTDSKGASGACSSVVTVNDTTAPSITAPPNKTISVCTNVNLGTPTVSDNCGTPTVTNNAPSKFPLGTTIVTWTATDASGNFKKATQTITAVLGDDVSCCPAGTHIILGDENSNQLVGTSGSDCILGRGGDDVIDGRDGDDYISGGAGRDTIFGGNGNDHVYGGDGDDTIDVRPGNNFVDGGGGTDTCAFDPAHDTAVSCNP
jgi:hypothetical protein